ncbi:hypothetical protein H0H92_003373 [Tricholoma furcatifolium]|nr:hypothetical protein H0H92_003373 [Tricholoma furcatifolium]
MAGETIMALTYGLEIQEKDDPYVEAAAKGVHPLMVAVMPGAFLVDSIPILKYVPDWMPFAGFKKKAKEWRKYALDMINVPYDAVKRNIENGRSTPSFTLRSLERIDNSGNVHTQEYIIKSTAAALYAAIASGILGLLSNPEALQKARDEIDRVIGTERLPTFEDSVSLLSTALDEEDVFNGYRMPKGSVVIPNAWAMLHDENIYPQPFLFNPDRFIKNGKLDPNVRDPMHAAFGFGRRICPARYMAFSAVWIAIASIIATFDISKAQDDDGNVIEPRDEYLSALVCVPLPFKCSIRPRSKDAEVLIKETLNGEYYA